MSRQSSMVDRCPDAEEIASSVSQDQVKLFRTLREFKMQIECLPLSRVFIEDLGRQNSLDGYFFGGNVVSVSSESYSQGHDAIVFLEDEDAGMDALQVMVRISGELVELLPTLNTEYMMFIAGAYMEDDNMEFSQDTGKCVAVKGSEVKVWAVHPQAGDPRLYERVCGPGWWKQRKKRVQRRRQAREEKVRQSSLTNKTSTVIEQRPSDIGDLEQGPSGVGGTESVSRCIGDMEPGPSGVGGMEPGPSVSGRGLGSSGVGDTESDPRGVSGTESGPSGVGGMEPGPSGVSCMELSPSGVGGIEPSSDVVAVETSARVTRQRCRQQSFPSKVDISDSSSGESESSTSSDSIRDNLWSPKKSSASYKYTKLSDLQPGLNKVNVIGVVKEFSKPRDTRGTQFCSVLTIVDETNPLVGVKCIIFNPNTERLPQVKQEGDIVCLHRINTNEYRNVMQIEGPPFSGSLRFSSKVGRKMKPSTGSVSYTFTATERKRVRELRQWVLRRRRTELAKKLESIHVGDQFNLSCQVVWIAQSSPSNQTILSVWDGTLSPLPVKRCRFDGGDVTSDASLTATVGPELQQQITIEGVLPRKLHIRPGSYVFLNNVKASSHTGSGEVELRVKGENVELLSVGEFGHSELRESLECALAAQEVITTTPHDDLPLSTLQEVRDHALHGKPAKFHCMVKLVRVLTSSLEETVMLSCEQCSLFQPLPKSTLTSLESGESTEPCSMCTEAGQWLPESPWPQCKFLIRLLLADNSTSLEVHVPHEEAVILFRGLRPANLYQHQMPRYRLMKLLYQLSGGNPPFSQQAGDKLRPWISCCLLKVEHNHDLYYCLFDTVLKGD